MQQRNKQDPPEDAGQPTRRGLFSGKDPSQAPMPSPGDTRIEAMMAAWQKGLTDRLEEGLRAIQQTSVMLMQEIASEVWRAASGDKDAVQSSILEALSRDQAIRGVIAHSDERFQALALRTARLEDALTTLAETTRAMKGVLAEGVQSIRDAADSPSLQGMDDVRTRLQQIEQHLAATFERLDERDRILLGSLEEQIRDHGVVIRDETGRIVEALEGYVKDGVGAMGHLAQRVEQQAELIYDRVGMDTQAISDALSSHESWILRTLEASSTRVDESLERQVERVREVGREGGLELAERLERQIVGLGELVRSDSEALRQTFREVAVAQGEHTAQVLDERIGRVSEALTAATRWTVEEITRRIGEATAEALQGRMDEAINVIDRNMVRVSDTLETELDRLGQRADQAVDAAVRSRFDETIQRLSAAIEATERLSAKVEGATEEAMSRAIDERITALAKMIRSDNRILMERIETVSEQDQAKQALRAIKEVQASLPGDLTEVFERRMAALEGAMAKSDEALALRIDRVASRVAGSDTDLQSVMERMGDAMHAIASLGRAPSRIDLD